MALKRRSAAPSRVHDAPVTVESRVEAARGRRRLSLLLGLLLAAGCSEEATSGLPPPPVFNLDVRGDALFVALGPSGVAVVDVEAWAVAGTLALSTKYQPHHLSVSPDRRHIGVGAPAIDLSGGHGGHTGHGAEPGGGALYILDSQKGDVTAQALPGGTAHNLAFVDDARVGYALMESGRLVLAGAADLRPGAEVAVGSAPLEVSPSPIGLLVANSGSGSISVVGTGSAGSADPPLVSATLPVGANPIAAWVGAAGRAYVTSESDQKLTALALAEGKAEPTVTLPGRPGQALEVGGATGEVWVALEDQGKILILSAADLAVKVELPVGKKPHGLCLSARGHTVFLTDEADGRIYSIDVKSRAVLRSLYLGGAPNGIVFRAAL